MHQKTYFAYLRVSTLRQGQTGTSLLEQRSAIFRYAAQHHLVISKEFEEQETAATKGRKVFHKVMKLLEAGKADGLIMHKIDRGARNLKDWAELGDLIDAGVDVHFANEQLDLYSRGGRLSADIQAVVAADYIRNLREEVKKGFYGRIKQGLYPMPAPIGYINQGGGKVKAIDTALAPLILKTFQLYATGTYTLDTLRARMFKLGLCGKEQCKLSRNALSHLLHNPFYTGVIHIKLHDEYFPGKHTPIVSKELFDQVQLILKWKLHRDDERQAHRERFLYRRMVICQRCQQFVIAEKQKQYHYYRCQNSQCPQKTIREEIIHKKVMELLRGIEKAAKRLQDRIPQFFQTASLTFQRASYSRRREILSQIINAICVDGKVVTIQLTSACNELFSENMTVPGSNENLA